MTHTNPTCETCRWWANDKAGHSGECHRYPPSLNHAVVHLLAKECQGSERTIAEQAEWQSAYSAVWYHPVTDLDYFCGEHSPRIPLPTTGEHQ